MSRFWIEEYLTRLRLAKIGYQSDFEQIDNDRAQVFRLISQEFDRLEEQEIKRKRKR